VIALPRARFILRTAGAHAAGRATAFVEEVHRKARTQQCMSA